MFNLEQAMEAAWRTHEEDRAAKEAEREEAKKEQREEERANLMRAFAADVGVDMCEALQAEARASAVPSVSVEVYFQHGGRQWGVWPSRWGNQRIWRVDTPRSGRSGEVFGHELRVQLLLMLAENARITEAIERDQAAYKEKSEREEAERIRRKAEEQAVHARCLARVEAAKEQAEAEGWRWPEGRVLKLYHWRYCTGYGEDGDIDYDYAWSAADRLDEEGYFLAYTFMQNPRRVRLISEVHKPVVTEYTFNSTKSLPPELQQDRYARVQGVVWEEYGNLLAEQEELGIDISISPVPRPFIRELLAQATANTTRRPG